MKAAVIRRGLVAVALLLSAGCGTLVFPLQHEREAPAVAPGQQEIAQSAEALAQYGMGMIESLAGNEDEAFRHYQEAVRNDPGNMTLRLELAAGYFSRGRIEEMDATLDHVLEKQPDNIRALQLRALGYRMRGRHAEALPPLETAIRLEPGEAVHYLECASVHARLGDLPKAMDVLEHSLGKVTNRLAVFQALGEIYIRQAAEVLKDGDVTDLPKTPLEIMASAAEDFPRDPYLLTLYGDLLILHQDIEKAIEVFARIEELDPTDLALRQKLALSLVAVGNIDRAIELLTEIVEERPQAHRLWYYLAELHEQNKDPGRAAECYREAIKARPDLPHAYLKLAYLYLQQKKSAEAIEVLSQGSAANPGELRIMEMQAYVYLSMDDFTNAVATFRRVETLMAEQQKKPMLENFHLNYAIACQMSGDKEGAARLLRAGAEAEPDILDDFMAVNFRERGNRDQVLAALEILQGLSDLMPRETSSYTLYALLAFNIEEYATALTLLKQAEDIAIQAGGEEELTSQFYFWLGSASERTRDYEAAESYFLQAISIQPDHADSHNYLAYMHAERGVKLDMAMDHVGVALAIEPENAAYLDTRGWIYYQQGDYTNALADISLAAEKMPEDPTIADHLGDIYLALGDEAKAIEWWKKSLAADPDNQKVKEKLQAREKSEPSP